MDKRIFQIRYRLYQQIIMFIILAYPVLLYAQENNTHNFPVYRDNNIVGYLYTETTLDDKNCYTLDTLHVFEKEIIIQTEVGYVGHADGSKMFYPDFFVTLEMSNNNAVIKFNSTINGNTYWLSVKKEESGAIYIDEEFLWYPNASVNIEIAKDDFNSFRCSHICRKKGYRLVEDKIVFSDYFDFNDPSKECFDCPTKYSLEECLEIKKSDKTFIWSE